MAALTLEIVQRKLIARCNKKMALVGFSTETTEPNPDLVDPITSAMADLGIEPGNIAAVNNLDVARVQVSQVQEFFDRAELRLLENIANNIDMVNITLGPRREELSDLSTQVEKAISRMIDKVSRLYGDSASAAPKSSTGVLDYGFQEQW